MWYDQAEGDSRLEGKNRNSGEGKAEPVGLAEPVQTTLLRIDIELRTTRVYVQIAWTASPLLRPLPARGVPIIPDQSPIPSWTASMLAVSPHRPY